ncbi:MAG: hypothetical protein RIS64_4369 [Bacteroidota bacterium]|jgi:hypothetical protein
MHRLYRNACVEPSIFLYFSKDDRLVFCLRNLQICFTQISKLHHFQKVLNILNYFQKK